MPLHPRTPLRHLLAGGVLATDKKGQINCSDTRVKQGIYSHETQDFMKHQGLLFFLMDIGFYN